MKTRPLATELVGKEDVVLQEVLNGHSLFANIDMFKLQAPGANEVLAALDETGSEELTNRVTASRAFDALPDEPLSYATLNRLSTKEFLRLWGIDGGMFLGAAIVGQYDGDRNISPNLVFSENIDPLLTSHWMRDKPISIDEMVIVRQHQSIFPLDTVTVGEFAFYINRYRGIRSDSLWETRCQEALLHWREYADENAALACTVGYSMANKVPSRPNEHHWQDAVQAVGHDLAFPFLLAGVRDVSVIVEAIKNDIDPSLLVYFDTPSE
jgi:hypothetical protein